jgi:DNA-binding MurR/RpiR family transcriptional regulator
MSVTAQIHAHMNSLTPAERAFAEYVLEHDDIIYKSITLATEDSSTGYGTIIRFCQKLGYSGFQDFKIHLAQEKGRTRSAGQRGGEHEGRKDTGPEVDSLALAAEKASRQIGTTASGLSEKVLERVAARLASSSRVLTIGVAGSYPTALELSYRLSRMGIHATAESDGHMQAILAGELDETSSLVAVSYSGATRDILDAVERAGGRGVYVAAITNYRRSPLTEIADDVLCTSIWEQALESEIGTRVPFLFVLEVLCGMIYRAHAEAREALARTSDSVASKQI